MDPKKRSCLVVDDSRVVRRVARRIAEDLGFECFEAEDGQAAYESCQNAIPDVIILDWNMPRMSGIEFLEKLRLLKFGERAQVIFCSAEGGIKHIQRALDAGANEYIVKPFDREVIKSKFSKLGLVKR